MLFPARTGAYDNAKAHAVNRLGAKSFVHMLRMLLVSCKLLTPAQAKFVRGHSLRVGGSNNCRRQGVPDGTHRLMGGWASLASSAAYMALTTAEQFAITDKMAAPTRDNGIENMDQAQRALGGTLPRMAGTN
jgi:hypothetical protein